MPKKTKKDIYMWYSPATDITGKKLAEALGISHGKEKPSNKHLVIGWGTKTNEITTLTNKTTPLTKVTALNHPDNIRVNRNKLGALSIMLSKGVNVAPFIEAENINSIGKGNSKVIFPVIGRTKFHQGGKGFWNCPTMTHVKAAVEDGAQYFQNLIEVVNEYRVHTFENSAIHVVKKVKRSIKDMEEAFVRHELDRQKSLAVKNNNPFDEDTAKLILTRQAKKFAQDGANMLIRSNRAGWKFVQVKKPATKIVTESVKAINALNLQFGAVDCCVDINGKEWIFEVNSGPGLEQTPFECYVAAFKTKIDEILGIGKQPVRKIKATIPTSLTGTPSKDNLKSKLSIVTELVNKADEEDIETLNRLFAKVFGD